ncbi:MAG: hypothetical protein CME06_06635 [Gemmatimonadetes bacterium]|nr:hypothetical protein [Gemmatimonadota bacterium]
MHFSSRHPGRCNRHLFRVVALVFGTLDTSSSYADDARHADQVHLAFLGDARYSVAWAGAGALLGAHVRFWTDRNEERRRAPAEEFAWGRGERKRYGYGAVLDRLGPGLVVHYVVADSGGGLVEERVFRTEPTADQPFTIVAWGDLGTHEASAQSVRMATDDAPSILLHAGDLAYAGGDQRVWDRWFRMIEPLAATVPYMPAPGNHEYERGRGCSTYSARFYLPGNERYYTTRWGSVDVLFLDTEEDLSLGSVQYRFAEGALAGFDTDSERWKLIVLHKPLWSSGRHGSSPKIARALTPLLHRYDVDLVLAGHDHNFERAWPLWGRKILRPVGRRSWGSLGFDHLVTGTAGRPTYRGGYSDFTAYQVSRIHYSRIRVEGDRLRIDAVGVPSGEVFHAWEIAAGWTDCPALAAAERVEGGRERLPALRSFRDGVLAGLPGGRDLVGDYYRNGGEVLRLLDGNEAASELAGELLVALGDGVAAEGGGWVPDRSARDGVAKLARTLAGGAKPNLAALLGGLAGTIEAAPGGSDLRAISVMVIEGLKEHPAMRQ